MRRRSRGLISPVNLLEVYAYPGEHAVKFIIDPAESPDVESVNVMMTNADGKPMRFSFKRWGTKVNLSFLIDEATPDGVSIIDISLSRPQVGETRERFDFWTIK